MGMNLLWLPPPDISATKGHFRMAEHDITPISTARYCAASASAFDLPHRALQHMILAQSTKLPMLIAPVQESKSPSTLLTSRPQSTWMPP